MFHLSPTTGTSDTLLAGVNWHSACQNKALFTDGKRPREYLLCTCTAFLLMFPTALAFRLVMSVVINGLIGHHAAGTQVTNAPCPFELSQTAA